MDAVAVGVAKPEEFPRRMWVGCGLSWLGLGWVGSMSPWPGTSCYKNTDTATAAEIQIRVDLAGLNRHGMRSGWLVAWCVGRKKKHVWHYEIRCHQRTERSNTNKCRCKNKNRNLKSEFRNSLLRLRSNFDILHLATLGNSRLVAHFSNRNRIRI